MSRSRSDGFDRVGGHETAARAFGALAFPVFCIDGEGRILASSQAGDRMLDNGGLFELRQGRLRGVNRDADMRLLDGIEGAAVAGVDDTARAFLTQGDSPAELLRIDINRVQDAPNGEAQILVQVSPRRAGAVDGLLDALGLTGAEQVVATAAARGLAPEEIARQRSVALPTVRVQLRSIFAKLGVRKHSELVAMLRPVI